MPFKRILVALDGSAYSKIAIDYGLWLASKCQASVTGLHVVDPRLIDLIISPQLSEALGFSKSVDTAEKVSAAMEEIGTLILKLFREQTEGKAPSQSALEVGWVVESIRNRAQDHDLVIVGHRGSKDPGPAELLIGSVAERVVLCAGKPVLVASHPIGEVKEITVAFDGSEPSRGALLLGEALSIKTGLPLRAITAVLPGHSPTESRLTVEQGQSVLREQKSADIFITVERPAPDSVLKHAHLHGSLIVLGAYGFRTPEENVLGSTTTSIIRRAKNSVLVFR